MFVPRINLRLNLSDPVHIAPPRSTVAMHGTAADLHRLDECNAVHNAAIHRRVHDGLGGERVFPKCTTGLSKSVLQLLALHSNETSHNILLSRLPPSTSDPQANTPIERIRAMLQSVETFDSECRVGNSPWK